MNQFTQSFVLPAGIALREASEADIPEIVRVVNAAFDVESFFVNRPRTHSVQLAEHFRSGHFLLAHRGDWLAASVYCEPRGAYGYIGMLAVDPAEQHTGLGRVMMQAAEQFLGRSGCTTAELYVVDVRTALFPMYRKLGYRETGTEDVPEELRQKLTMPVRLIKMEKPLIG